MQHRIEAHRDQLEAYEGLCRELGAKPAEVALAWLLRNPVVSTTVVGATTTEELRVGPRRGDLCSWTPRSWNDSTRSGPGRGKPRRRTPGEADPGTCQGLLDRQMKTNVCSTGCCTLLAVIVHCGELSCYAEVPPGHDVCPRCGSDYLMVAVETPKGTRLSAPRTAERVRVKGRRIEGSGRTEYIGLIGSPPVPPSSCKNVAPHIKIYNDVLWNYDRQRLERRCWRRIRKGTTTDKSGSILERVRRPGGQKKAG